MYVRTHPRAITHAHTRTSNLNFLYFFSFFSYSTSYFKLFPLPPSPSLYINCSFIYFVLLTLIFFILPLKTMLFKFSKESINIANRALCVKSHFVLRTEVSLHVNSGRFSCVTFCFYKNQVKYVECSGIGHI